ncbi:MAG: hypothetical protein GVY26_16525 [Bacteroidetes bacterium]|jgi:voltage-gated potassium channel|nr:hypothetical protein [Bacteroidota bacterium]
MHLIYQLNRRLKNIRRSFSSALRGQIAILGLLFLLLMLLHVLAMMLFEGLSLGDATWLTITTATTVGYGDISAATAAGRLSTALLMYLGGIFILAQLAGLVFEATAEKREQRLYGKLPINAQGHIVIFGWREAYLTDTVRQIRSSIAPLHDADIIIVSDQMTPLPDPLIQQEVRHVVGPIYDSNTLDKAAVRRAATVVISPEQEDYTADFTTLDLIQRLRAHGVQAPVIAELQDAARTEDARALGATHVQLFNPNYPDMLARSILAPGAEALVEEITKDSKTEMLVLHLPIATTAGEIRKAVHGTATLLGFPTSEDAYILHPDDSTTVKDHPLIFLVDTDRFGDTANARRKIESCLAPLTESHSVEGFRLPEKVGVIGIAARTADAYLGTLRKELSEEATVELVGEDCWSAPSLSLEGYDALVLLCDEPLQPQSDAKTFATIHLLRREWQYRGRLITEAVLPTNQARFVAAGANDVIRPVTKNLEILARCILTGAEEVLDNLFNSDGHELLRVDVNGQLDWQELADRIQPLGLALGYTNDEQPVEVLPPPGHTCRFTTLFLLIDRAEYTRFEQVDRAVRQALAG